MIPSLRPLTLLLVVLCGSLFAILAHQLAAPQQPIDIPKVSLSIALPQIPEVPAFDPPPAEVLLEINARPLFNPKREPVQRPEEKKVEPPPPPPPQISFIGTISQADRQLAMIKTPTQPLAFSVNVGTVVDGWEVSAISQDRILLSAKSASHEVRLNQAPVVQQRNAAIAPARSTRARASVAAPAPRPGARARFRGVQVQ